MENNQNTNPLHPFGENPFGEDFVKDDSFGYLSNQNDDGQDPEDEHGNDRVCPVCGAPMQETETYCMSCGMTVMPVFKKDYLKSKEQKQKDFGPGNNGTGYGNGGNSYGGSGYGSSGYGDSGYGGYGSGSASSGPAPSGPAPASQNTKMNAIIISAIAVVMLLIVGILAGLNGSGSSRSAGKYEKAYYKMAVKQNGQSIEDLYEITYKGDKIISMVETAILDVSDMSQNEIDSALSYIQSAGSKYMKYSCVDYEAKQDGKKLLLIITYKDLDKKSNVNDLVSAGLIEVDEYKKNITYVSLSQTKKLLQQKGYTEYYK